MKENLVSIIIPTYNRRRLMDECLHSVFLQDYKEKEVIVIDDNSSDNTLELINKKYKSVKIIKNFKNVGPSFAKNQGILQSNGEFVLFLDSDSELIKPDTISNMVNILKKDKNIGEIGGEAVFDEKGKIIGVGGKKISRKSPYVYLNEKMKLDLKSCDYINTSNCMTRRKTLLKVGGFDPYFFYPCEDLDLGIRIKKMGLKNLISIKTAANHKYSNFSRLNKPKIFSKSEIRYNIKTKGISGMFSIIFYDSLDWIRFFTHYLGLANKIKKLLNKKKEISEEYNEITSLRGEASRKDIKRYLLSKHYYLIKSLVWNLFYLRQTIKSRNLNFLDENIMKSYEKSLK